MATYSVPTSTSHPVRLDPHTVAVLLGGPSAEREISLASGAAVAQAMRERGHHVIEIDPQGIDLQHYDWSGIDVAFLALHGKFGEDGTIQTLLDKLGVVYTGSDAEASRLGFSKSAAKERFFHWGIPTPQYVLIHQSDTAQRIQQQAQTLGYPLVIKPDTQGSSLGVSIVRSPDDLAAALTKCFHLDAFGLMESFVAGTEWTVGMLDDTVLPAIQITTPHEFFDFSAKYADEATGYHFEFQVTSDVVRRVEQVAQLACRAIGTRGLARVDMIVDGAGRPWILEVNTIPGLTDHSLVPKAAAQLGWDFGELCDRALIGALHRSQARAV